MNKLLKRALMLGTLVVCLATAAWAGNVEMDCLDGNMDCDVAFAAEGYYMASQEYSNTWATYPDSKVTYNLYFNTNGEMTWGNSTSSLGTATYRNDYDADGFVTKTVTVSNEDGVEVSWETFTYDDEGLLTQSHYYSSFKGGSAVEDNTYYYTYEDNKVTVKEVTSNPTGDDVVNYVYTLDNNGYIVTCDYQATENSDYSGTVSYTYDARGNLTGLQYGDGGKYAFEYNDKDLCIKKTYVTEEGGETVTTYEYDEHGNVLKEVENNYSTYTCTYEAIPQGGSKSSFADVNAKEYYNAPVIWATENKITKGTGTTTFSPGKGCSRAELVTFLWRAAGEPEPENAKNPFTDVAAGSYYEKAVLWAVEKGITKGVDVGKFAPDQTCTRAQIVTFIYRAAGKPEVTGTNPFIDVEKNDYYDAILWAVENGITNGVDVDKFAPNQTCTRAQGVTFLYRGIGLY